MRHAPLPGHTDTDWDGDPIIRKADAPYLEVDTSENPIVDMLLDHRGRPLRTWRARPPVGYQGRRTDTRWTA